MKTTKPAPVDYEPFGDGWRAYLMKLPKALLVEMLREAYISQTFRRKQPAQPKKKEE